MRTFAVPALLLAALVGCTESPTVPEGAQLTATSFAKTTTSVANKLQSVATVMANTNDRLERIAGELPPNPNVPPNPAVPPSPIQEALDAIRFEAERALELVREFEER